MNNKINLSLILLALVFLSAGCVSSLPKSQLQFGVEAAQYGLWDEAIFRWKKVLQFEPDSAAAHNNLAVAYEKKGEFEKAEKEYQKALQLNPKNEQIQANYRRFQNNLDQDRKKEEKNEKK
ncbi:MAG: tetratricopeptide repeat protein [Candidatus Aminicenantes bacterium]|nr:tetratricopeptide repeat protein [Candidatus Aminicenantes bacterium]